VEEKRSRELFASQKTDWPARVVREFEAARRRYVVLRGPLGVGMSVPSRGDLARNAG